LGKIARLLLLNTVIGFVFYAVIDATLSLMLLHDGVGIKTWSPYLTFIEVLFSAGVVLSFYVTKNPNWYSVKEAIVVAAMPFVMIWTGLMDVVSATATMFWENKSAFEWVYASWGYESGWTWLTPRDTFGIPFLPYILSQLGHGVIVDTTDVICGAFIGLLILIFTLWMVRNR